MRVTVIGDAHLDVSVRPDEPMRPGGDVPAAIRLLPGGQGANVAVRLARRGVAVDLVAPVGDDVAGQAVSRALEAEGVDLRRIPAATSGTVMVLLAPDGERSMLSQRIPFADLVEALPTGADWLVVSGYLLLEPGADALTARLSSTHARRVLLGCAVPDALLPRWHAAAQALAPHLLVLNRDERDRLEPIDAGVEVVTDPGGATAANGGDRIRVEASPGPPASDTTGAGDAFAAALLASLPSTWPPDPADLERAVGDALAAAGAVARVEGAQGWIDGERAR